MSETSEKLDKIVKGMELGIPLDILRKMDKNIIIRDNGNEYKLLLRGHLNFIDSTRIVYKENLKRLRNINGLM